MHQLSLIDPPKIPIEIIENNSHKQCSQCKEIKLIEHFAITGIARDGGHLRKTLCKQCKNLNRRIIEKLKKNIALPPAPGTLCAIPDCTREATCLDHCHETNRPRGYICSQHNTALGLAGDNAKGVEALLAYIKQWEEKSGH